METFNWTEMIVGIFATSGVAAWLSAWLTSKDNNTFIQLAKDLLNAFGGNIWNGKNADDDR